MPKRNSNKKVDNQRKNSTNSSKKYIEKAYDTKW